VATTAAILDALAAQLRTQLAAVTDVDLSIEGRAFAAATVPAVDMYVTAPNGLADPQGYGEIQGGVPINVRVRVSTADLYTGEDLLLALTDDEDPLSITAAIDSDVTLGGLTSDIVWGDWGGYTDFPAASEDGGMYLGSLLPCLLIKARS
jgi:hypothetical protein